MHWLPWVLGSIVLLHWVAPILEALLARWHPIRMEDLPADGPDPLPRLSIIVPALNEEETIEPAMRTLLALDYPLLEIIAVNDRSTDRTGEILHRLASGNDRLKVVDVSELPPGWLGKNHAMHAASQAAKGDFLLFTDADIHFEPTTMRRAVRFMMSRTLDHVAVIPGVIRGGFWESVALGTFGMMFTMYTRPWKVSNPRSSHHIGVGAFNLVRTEAYRKIGGHAALPMDVLDDVKLGKLIKRSGGRQEAVFGMEFVKVRWVVGVSGMIHGMTKNMFAGFGFNPILALLAAAFLPFVTIWPYAGLFVGPAGARALCGAALLLMGFLGWKGAESTGLPRVIGFTYPIGALIFDLIILRSMFATYRNGGVVWRGTLYPLQELRKNVI